MKWCNEGETHIGEQYLKTRTLYLGLYLENPEPAETATLASLTEPSGGGYARIALTGADWTEDGVLKGLWSQLQKTFTATGGAWGSVYGYFVATSSDGTGKLNGVEHFSDGPYITPDGSIIRVTPVIDFREASE